MKDLWGDARKEVDQPNFVRSIKHSSKLFEAKQHPWKTSAKVTLSVISIILPATKPIQSLATWIQAAIDTVFEAVSSVPFKGYKDKYHRELTTGDDSKFLKGLESQILDRYVKKANDALEAYKMWNRRQLNPVIPCDQLYNFYMDYHYAVRRVIRLIVVACTLEHMAKHIVERYAEELSALEDNHEHVRGLRDGWIFKMHRPGIRDFRRQNLGVQFESLIPPGTKFHHKSGGQVDAQHIQFHSKCSQKH